MTSKLVLMAHEYTKCIHRKLNVTDFQFKHKGKYTLNVNVYIFTPQWEKRIIGCILSFLASHLNSEEFISVVYFLSNGILDLNGMYYFKILSYYHNSFFMFLNMYVHCTDGFTLQNLAYLQQKLIPQIEERLADKCENLQNFQDVDNALGNKCAIKKEIL